MRGEKEAIEQVRAANTQIAQNFMALLEYANAAEMLLLRASTELAGVPRGVTGERERTQLRLAIRELIGPTIAKSK